MRGAATAGADVLDIGLVGTEMVYFAVGSLGLDGGIMVTASHNPKEYTGMKIVRRGALPVGGESGLLDVRDRALEVTDVKGGGAARVSEFDIWPAYVERVRVRQAGWAQGSLYFAGRDFDRVSKWLRRRVGWRNAFAARTS